VGGVKVIERALKNCQLRNNVNAFFPSDIG
jgi:hypothetical protein